MAIEGGGDYRQRLAQRQLQIKKRKQAGLSDTRADAGPPSSKTFSSPPAKPSFLSRVAVSAGEAFAKEDKDSFLYRTGLQKIPQFVFPKYAKSAEQMTQNEQREAELNLLEIIPGIGDIASIGRYTEDVSEDPTGFRPWAKLIGMGALSVANPFGGAGQVKRAAPTEIKEIQKSFEDAITRGDDVTAEALAQTLSEVRGAPRGIKPKPLSQRIDDAIAFSAKAPENKAAVEVTDEELRVLTLRNPAALKSAVSGRKPGQTTTRIYIAPREEAPLLQQLRNQKGRPDYKRLKDELIRRGLITEKEAKELEKTQNELYKAEYQNIFGLEDTDRATNYYFYTVGKDGKRIPLDEEPDHIEAQAKLARYAHKLLLDPSVDNNISVELFRLINDPINFAGLHKRTNQSMGSMGAEKYVERGRDVEGLFEPEKHYMQRALVAQARLRSILGPKYYQDYQGFDEKKYKFDTKSPLEIIQGFYAGINK